MALGKELGTFDLKSTSFTLIPGKNKTVEVSANFEGRVQGRTEGDVIATMTFASPDGKDGTYTVSTRTLFDDGSIQDASGQGKTTYESGHTWRVAGVAEISNGRSYGITGEIDYVARTFKGTIFDRI